MFGGNSATEGRVSAWGGGLETSVLDVGMRESPPRHPNASPPDAADAVQRQCSISDFTDAAAAWSQKVHRADAFVRLFEYEMSRDFARGKSWGHEPRPNPYSGLSPFFSIKNWCVIRYTYVSMHSKCEQLPQFVTICVWHPYISLRFPCVTICTYLLTPEGGRYQTSQFIFFALKHFPGRVSIRSDPGLEDEEEVQKILAGDQDWYWLRISCNDLYPQFTVWGSKVPLRPPQVISELNSAIALLSLFYLILSWQKTK